MAEFAVVLYSPAPADPMDYTPEELAANDRFGKKLEELGGEMVVAKACLPSTAACAVRDGVVSDGTFLDSKEVIAGFFVLEARDIEHAKEIAQHVPAKPGGGVEVRPLLGE
ncbi:YciI family protein [Streptomyces sp. O3]